jgi:hypothetical protein
MLTLLVNLYLDLQYGYQSWLVVLVDWHYKPITGYQSWRVTDGIGDNASTNIRNKILLGEYIDLTREDDGCKNVDAPEPISTTETQASGSTDDLRLQPVTPLSKKKNS